jgi:hypothetical protein
MKLIPGGIVTLYFLHADYGNKSIFELWWGIRIDRMADIYNQVVEKDQEYHHLTRVLWNHLGALIDYIENGNELTRADPKKYIVLKDQHQHQVGRA